MGPPEYTVKFIHDSVKLWLHRLLLRRGYHSQQEPAAYEVDVGGSGAFPQKNRPDLKVVGSTDPDSVL